MMNKRAWPKVIFYLVLVLLCAFFGGEHLIHQPNTPSIVKTDESMLVSFLDVGQGDSAFIEFPGGQTALIDAGEAAAVSDIIRYIESRGHQKVDYLICTHPHADHIGGMAGVVNALDIGSVYMPKVSHTSKTFEKLLLAIEKNNLRVHTAKAGVSIDVEPGIVMNFVGPVGEQYEEMNDYSAVVRLTYGEVSFLFTGDAEVFAENEMLSAGAALQADVLKVGHHGSVTSTGDRFLQAVSPTWAVISVGKDNDYGHPHQATLKKLKKQNITFFRTDQNGRITAVTDGKSIKIQGERP